VPTPSEREDINPTTEEPIKEYSHAHFGVGNLGLGLVLPALSGIPRLVIFQRISDEWNRLKAKKKITLASGNGFSLKLRFIDDRNNNSPDYIEECYQAWLDGEAVFIFSSTDNWERYKKFIENSDTLSCSLKDGQEDLIRLLHKLKLKQGTTVFPFENVIDRGFDSLKGLTTIKVVADRICHSRKVFKDRVEVEAEHRGEIVLNCSRESFPQLFESRMEDIKLIFSEHPGVFEYYYRRKRYLINGLHFALTICCYDALRELNIPHRKWGEQYLSIVLGEVLSKDGRYLQHIRNYVDGQIMRLVLECRDALSEIYPNGSEEDTYDDLRYYSDEMLRRAKLQPDDLKRILDFTDPKRTIKNNKYHLKDSLDFVVSNVDRMDVLKLRRRSYADDVLKSVRTLEGFLTEVSLQLAAVGVKR